MPSYTDSTYTLLSNASATGAAVEWPGGRGVFSVPSGTFGGATMKLQFRQDRTNWIDVDQSGSTFVTLTAAGAGLFELPSCFIRANVSGGSPSGLNAIVQGTGVC